MTNGVSFGFDAGLLHGTPPRVACDLAGGTEALATRLLEVSVVPGSDVLLVAEGNDPEGAPLAVVWGEPAFIGPAGEMSLLELGWQPLDVLSGEVAAFRAAGDRELLLGGRPCDAAVMMIAPAGLRVRVPPGGERLVVECGFDGAALPGALARVRCSVYSATPASAAATDSGARDGV